MWMQVLEGEQDLSTKRNAFQFLAQHAQPRAVSYLLSQLDNVAMWGDILQMAVLDLIRKVGSASFWLCLVQCGCISRECGSCCASQELGGHRFVQKLRALRLW